MPGLDPSIILQAQPPPRRDPFERFTQLLNLRAVQEQAQDRAEARAARQMARTDADTLRQRRGRVAQGVLDTRGLAPADRETRLGQITDPEERLAVEAALREFDTARQADLEARAHKLGMAARLATQRPDFMGYAFEQVIADDPAVRTLWLRLIEQPERLQAQLDRWIANDPTPPAPPPDYSLGQTRFSGVTNQPVVSTERPPTRAVVTTDAGGRPVTQIIEDVPGQTFPVPQAPRAEGVPASAGGDLEPPSLLVQAVFDNPVLFQSLTPTAKERLIPALSRRGFKFAVPALTPSLQGANIRLESSLEILKTLDPGLTPATGFTGRVQGLLQLWWARTTGNDTVAELYDGVSESIVAALARSSGEVGNLAEKEQIRYRRLAPKVSDPSNIRYAKYAALQFLMDAARAGQTSDQLRPFLDYMQFAPSTRTGADPAAAASGREKLRTR